MTKRYLFWTMALVAGMSLFACKQKKANDEAEQSQEEQTEQVESEEAQGQESDPAADIADDLSQSYTICPFCLQDKAQVDGEGQPVTVTRKWVGVSESVGCSTIADWVLYTQDPRFALNPDGWHFVGKDIVNADETYKINSEDAFMSLSSFCTVRTEKYVKPKTVEKYCHVTRSRLYAFADDVECPRLITSGNRHQYAADAVEAVGNLENAEDRVQTSFFLQEWVNVILPADSDYTLAVMPYRLSYEGVTFDDEKLSQALWQGVAEASEDSSAANASFYLSEEQPAGFYDLLFIKDQKAQCRLTMVMTKEEK